MNKENILRFLRNIWPTVYRIVNTSLYFLINLIKDIITRITEQLFRK